MTTLHLVNEQIFTIYRRRQTKSIDQQQRIVISTTIPQITKLSKGIPKLTK